MDTPIRSIHVMAAVITDARGRILLARRDGTSDLAGLWEFPGGKREPGESCEDALVRELQEELDITVEVGPALMQVPQQYPNKRLRLDVRQVTVWQGKPRGHEGQALTWVAPDKLPRYSMPPADVPVVAALLQPDRYLLTPEPLDDESWMASLSMAIAGGILRVCLHAPALSESDASRWQNLVRRVVTQHREVDWLVYQDIELATELGIGVHLSADQLAQISSRPLSDEQRVAANCVSEQHMLAAASLGCDFVLIGSTPDSSATAFDWEAFEALREMSALPMYASGDVHALDVEEARTHGAQGVAVTQGLWPADA